MLATRLHLISVFALNRYGRVTVLSVFECIARDQKCYFFRASNSENPDKKAILITCSTFKNGQNSYAPVS